MRGRGPQHLREQVVRLGSSLRPAPGGVFCGTAVPAPNDARGSPSALPRAGAPPCTRGSFLRDGSPSTHLLGAPPQTPGDFRFTTKVTKGVSGGAPLNPRGGHYHPPSGVAAPPRRTLPLGVVGGVGLCFPPRRIGAQAADTLSFIQEKNCCEPGGEHRPYIADRGRLGYGNKKWEQGNKHLFLLYIHLYIYLL